MTNIQLKSKRLLHTDKILLDTSKKWRKLGMSKTHKNGGITYNLKFNCGHKNTC